MDVDWNQALQVGMIGFALVFLVLVILALVMQFTGWFFNKSVGFSFKNFFKKGEGDEAVTDLKIESEEEPEYDPDLQISNGNNQN